MKHGLRGLLILGVLAALLMTFGCQRRVVSSRSYSPGQFEAYEDVPVDGPNEEPAESRGVGQGLGQLFGH